MKLFGQLVRTVVNVATLPAEAFKDVVDPKAKGSHTGDAIERLKREAAEQRSTR